LDANFPLSDHFNGSNNEYFCGTTSVEDKCDDDINNHEYFPPPIEFKGSNEDDGDFSPSEDFQGIDVDDEYFPPSVDFQGTNEDDENFLASEDF